jgi:hypothetical protein
MPLDRSAAPAKTAPTEPTLPFEQPSTTTPAEAPSPAETTPTKTPAETPAEDIFSTPTTPAEAPSTEKPAESGTNDIFSEPPASGTPSSNEGKPAEGTAPADGGSPLDMFNTPAEKPTDGAKEGASTEKVKKARTFMASNVLGEPGGLASSEMRTWVDNTGRYSCQGRLVRFMDGYVRLVKDNGRMTTVPLYRLSANDLAFVNRQASAGPQETFAQAETAEANEVTAN